MNLKDWGKISEDDKTVTMKHPKGHVMVIAIKALPKIQQEAIKRLKMADGGDVSASGKGGVSEQGRDVRHGKKQKERGDFDEHAMSMDFAKDEAKGRAKFEKEHVKPKLQGLAEGGEVKGFKNPELAQKGLDAIRSKGQTPEQKEKNKAFWSSADVLLKHGEKHPDKYAKGGNVQHYAGTSGAQMVAPPEDNGEEAQSTSAPVAAPAQPQMTDPSIVPTQTPVQAEMPSNVSLTPDPLQQRKAQVGAEIAGLNMAQQRATNIANQNSFMHEQADKYAQEMDKEVDTNRLMRTMSAPAQTANLIGLFLGGLAVPFGGHNYAQDAINKRIDADVEAQKLHKTQAKNVWDAYHQLYGDDILTTNATKEAQADTFAHVAKLAALGQNTTQAIKGYINLKQNVIQPIKQKARQDNFIRSTQLNNGAPAIKNGRPVINPGAASIAPSSYGLSPADKMKLEHKIGKGNSNGYAHGGKVQYYPTGGMVDTPSDQGSSDSQNGLEQTLNQNYENNQQKAMQGYQNEAPPPQEPQYESTLPPFILNDDHNQKMKNLINQPPEVLSPEDKAKVYEQHTNAALADDGMAEIAKLYPRMKNETSFSQWLESKVNPAQWAEYGAGAGAAVGAGAAALTAPETGGASLLAIPYAAEKGAALGGIGGGIAAGAAEGLTTLSDKQRIDQYNADKAQMFGVLRRAMPNAGDPAIWEMVNSDTPGYFDNKKTAQQKIQNLYDKLRLIPKDALERNDLINKPKMKRMP